MNTINIDTINDDTTNDEQHRFIAQHHDVIVDVDSTHAQRIASIHTLNDAIDCVVVNATLTHAINNDDCDEFMIRDISSLLFDIVNL